MRILVVVVSFALSCAVAVAGSTPTFVQPGRSYVIESVGGKQSVSVLEIGSEGWIRVQAEKEPFWLNTNLIWRMTEISDDQVKTIAALAAVKTSMAELRAIATSAEAYAVDNEHYPGDAGSSGSVQRLRSLVEPTYIRQLPLKDPWGKEYLYFVDESRQKYWIVSFGSDGRAESSLYEMNGRPKLEIGHPESTGPQDDLIFANGRFVRYPQLAERD